MRVLASRTLCIPYFFEPKSLNLAAIFVSILRAVETVILQDLTSQGVQKTRVSWRTQGFRGDEALYRGILPLYIELQALGSQSENAYVRLFKWKGLRREADAFCPCTQLYVRRCSASSQATCKLLFSKKSSAFSLTCESLTRCEPIQEFWKRVYSHKMDDCLCNSVNYSNASKSKCAIYFVYMTRYSRSLL